MTESGHLYIEVAVPAGDDVIVDHGSAGPIVFIETGGVSREKTKFLKEILQPDHILGDFGRLDVLCFHRAKTQSCGSLG